MKINKDINLKKSIYFITKVLFMVFLTVSCGKNSDQKKLNPGDENRVAYSSVETIEINRKKLNTNRDHHFFISPLYDEFNRFNLKYLENLQKEDILKMIDFKIKKLEEKNVFFYSFIDWKKQIVDYFLVSDENEKDLLNQLKFILIALDTVDYSFFKLSPDFQKVILDSKFQFIISFSNLISLSKSSFSAKESFSNIELISDLVGKKLYEENYKAILIGDKSFLTIDPSITSLIEIERNAFLLWFQQIDKVKKISRSDNFKFVYFSKDREGNYYFDSKNLAFAQLLSYYLTSMGADDFNAIELDFLTSHYPKI